MVACSLVYSSRVSAWLWKKVSLCGRVSSLGKRILMVISSRRTMRTTSDICMVKKVRETITSLGTVIKPLTLLLLDLESTTDVLSKRSVKTTWGSWWAHMAWAKKTSTLLWTSRRKVSSKSLVLDFLKALIKEVSVNMLVPTPMDSSHRASNTRKMLRSLTTRRMVKRLKPPPLLLPKK